MLQKKTQLESVSVLRALCCLGVISLHCHLSYYLAYVSVTVFFVLSGFLLTYNYYSKDSLDSVSAALCVRFSLKKIKKLYPLHILTLLFFLAEQFYGLFSGLAKPSFAFFFPSAANILLIQSWFPAEWIYYSLNIPSWYLSVSVFLYLMFPLILKAVKRFKSISQAIWLSAAIFAVQILLTYIGYQRIQAVDAFLGQEHGMKQWVLYICPPLRLESFSIGCNLGYIFLKKQNRQFDPAKATAFELLTIAVTLLTIYKKQLPDWFPKYGRIFEYSLEYTLPAIMIVFAFAYGDGYIVKLLTNRPLLYLGKLSPQMYLIHYPVIAAAAFFVMRISCPEKIQRAIYLAFIAIFTVGLSELYSRAEKKIKNKRKTGNEARGTLPAQ